MRDALIAAADVANGAMVALVKLADNTWALSGNLVV